MGTKIWVAVMVALTGIYAFLLLERGLVLVQDSNPVAILMGIAILFFPLLAIWVLFAEIRFGMRLGKLNQLLAQSDIELPEYELRPSGKAERESGQRVFEQIRERIEGDELNPLLWLLLADSYDKLGDRSRARKAGRKAISLAKQAGTL